MQPHTLRIVWSSAFATKHLRCTQSVETALRSTSLPKAMAQQQVDISSMSLEQLNTYKGQFENEIKQLPVWKSTSASGARR